MSEVPREKPLLRATGLQERKVSADRQSSYVNSFSGIRAESRKIGNDNVRFRGAVTN
jgi:hypothetical protein